MKYITINDFAKAKAQANAAREALPVSHNRRRIKAEHRTMLACVQALPERKAGKPVAILYTRGCNLGTKKWNDPITLVEYQSLSNYVVKDTGKSFVFYSEGTAHKVDQINHSRVVAIIKG